MNSYEYLEFLKNKWKEEAANKNMTKTSSITIDWGELEYIFNHLQTYEQLLLIARMFYQETKDEQVKFVISGMVSDSVNEQLLKSSSIKQRTCYICAKNTNVTRSEQSCIVEEQVKYKCLDCLVSQLKDISTENRQLMEYRLFVKENQLEEQFEYFCEERKNESFQ